MDLAHFWNTSGAYQINQSLRFDGATNCYLRNASLGIYGNTNTTISFWLKHSTKQNGNIFACGTNPNLWSLEIGPSSSGGGRWLNNGGTIYVFPDGAGKLRDPAAWYHIVLRQTGNQSTIFVNGVQTNNNNSNSAGTNTGWYIGNEDGAGNNQLDGYLAEFVHVDGTAYDPSYFGEFDSITGAWIPKKISGITYGTKGFYLKFDPSATNGIGHDHSGNGNNFTATGFSTSGTGTDVMSDTPTNNWCTWNPLKTGPSTSLSNGNLDFIYTSADAPRLTTSTFAISSGKWYWEGTYGAGGTAGSSGFGIGKDPVNLSGSVAQSNVYAYHSNGNKYVDNVVSVYGATYTTNDIIGIAFDADTGTLTGYKNGTSQGTITTGLTSGPYFIVAASYDSASWTLNAGQRAFAYTPPTGYKALNTANLPEPTIKKGSKYFDTKLYTANNQTAQTITGLGFSPDLLWFKPRSRAEHHYLYDQVRGAGNRVSSSQTIAEVTGDNSLTAFTSDGFSLGTDGAGIVNYGTDSMVAWAWDANGAGSSNTAGTITSTVSANATAGFSIATYTGNGTAGATVGHGLGVAPKMIMVKRRDTGADWAVYHASTGATKYLTLNNTNSAGTSSAYWNNTEPTSTVFSLGLSSEANTNAATFVAYCFSEVAGYSKFGSYTGNGSSDGPFVFCGFRPRWILVKRTDSTGTWEMYDTARDTYNVMSADLAANLSDAEVSQARFDALSNGFKNRITGAASNASGGTYIFAAFSETAFKFANAR